MAVLKSNLCPTCGGLLNIDLDKQVYVCPFCGVTFDYEYFREDNVKEVASKAISRSEFGSAKDAYDFMLKKDPHDFEALRGLFLCRNKWKTMHPMLDDNNVNVEADEPTLLNAVENCLPEHKGYFEKVRESLKELGHYRELFKESEDLDLKKDSAITALDQLKHEFYENSLSFGTKLSNFWGDFWDMEGEDREALGAVGGMIFVVLAGVVIWAISWWFLLVTVLIVIGGIVGYLINKKVTAKRLRVSIDQADKKVQELTELYNAKKTETKQSHTKYETLVKEFMDTDPVPQEKPEDFPAVRKQK